MPHQTILASALVAGVMTGAVFAAASVIAMQAMGVWIEPAEH
ncbi:hypothetical protein NM680_06120 [Paracoccus sp. PS-1]|nr:MULTISPECIES: hypothetical protein [unclassified Paracoccus (in: a-proteobacteria)]MDQ7261377.1 hypothetical protein [Paracoccus sp. PS1]